MFLISKMLLAMIRVLSIYHIYLFSTCLQLGEDSLGLYTNSLVPREIHGMPYVVHKLL